MINGPAYENILREAEQLPREQCLMLIERLIYRMRTAGTTENGAPAWEDYAGSAPYPLCGEDAQEWIRRSRQESDRKRMFP